MNSEIDHFLFLNHKKTVYGAVRPYKYYTLKFSLLSLVETGWNLLRSDFDKENRNSGVQSVTIVCGLSF